MQCSDGSDEKDCLKSKSGIGNELSLITTNKRGRSFDTVHNLTRVVELFRKSVFSVRLKIHQNLAK